MVVADLLVAPSTTTGWSHSRKPSKQLANCVCGWVGVGGWGRVLGEAVVRSVFVSVCCVGEFVCVCVCGRCMGGQAKDMGNVCAGKRAYIHKILVEDI